MEQVNAGETNKVLILSWSISSRFVDIQCPDFCYCVGGF